MDESEIIFNPRSHDVSLAETSGAPENLMDFRTIDEVHSTPPITPQSSLNVERVINNNFDRIWGQIEDMFRHTREEMRCYTQTALAKVDEEISALRTQLQSQSSPSTRAGAGDQISHSVAESSEYRSRPLSSGNPFHQEHTTSHINNETREHMSSFNNNFAFNSESSIDQYRQNNENRGNVIGNPLCVTSWSSNRDPFNVAPCSTGSQNQMLQSRMNNVNVKMKPQYYDGTEDLDDYLSQFEILADLNKWNYETKSLYLAGSLKGDARTMLTELSPMERRDFHSLVRVLNLRFGSLNRAEIYKANLQTRVKRRDESISELAQSIKKLTRQAYPNAPSSVISTLARDHFIDALPESDMRLRIREAQAKDIAEAEILALRLEAYRVADRQKTFRNRGHQVNQVGSNNVDRGDKPENDPMVKSMMDGVRQEFKSFANDIKQVVKTAQNKQPEKDKNSSFRQNNGGNHTGNNNFRNRPQHNSYKNNYVQNGNRFNNRNIHSNSYKGKNNASNHVQSAQGNSTSSNTGASVRQMSQGPQQLP